MSIFEDDYIERFFGRGDDDDEYGELKGPALELFGTDLTALAREGKLDECFGREKELREMMEILIRRQKNNPVLVGDAGVGKTAIIESFANKIVSNLVPFVLSGRSIISIDLAKIVAGSRYRGEFEGRFRKVLEEAVEEPNIIIFIDEIHTLGGTGAAEGSLDAANMLKPLLARSGFQCIGATTRKEYEKIERDAALHRRFQKIIIGEPSVEDTVKILYSLRPNLEAFHNLEFSPGALRLAVELSHRYITDRFLPDKAIDLVDRVAARTVINSSEVKEESIIRSLIQQSLLQVGQLKVEAFRRGDTGTQFIFQEIENAYNSFLLSWIENPKDIPLGAALEKKATNSPISDELFERMRANILSRAEELLFASTNPIFSPTLNKNLFLTLSKNKTRKIIKKYEKRLIEVFSKNSILKLNRTKKKKIFVSTSIYRISAFLFSQFKKAKSLNNIRERKMQFKNRKKRIVVINDSAKTKYLRFIRTGNISSTPIASENENKFFIIRDRFFSLTNSPDKKNIAKYYNFLENTLKTFKLFKLPKYIQSVRKAVKSKNLNQKFDFFKNDTEKPKSNRKEMYVYNELENTQIDIFEKFLKDLKPILGKGLIKSLEKSSNLNLSKDELTSIYYLLGYYSNNSGKGFFKAINEPKLLKKTRISQKLLNFKTKIGRESIKSLVAQLTGIPLKSLGSDEQKKLLDLEDILHQRVIGQDDAIKGIAKAIRRARLGIQNPNRPIASFLFCGPTGVGKTEICKALANILFGSEKEMIRFDMSEFMEKFTLSRLIGSPPGYVGYDDGGQLTDAVRKKPYSVILFDEVEKSHPDILNILLQILEDGRLTDSQKRLIQFDNTLVIMTSNAAAGEIQSFLKNNLDNTIQKSDEADDLNQIETSKSIKSLDPYAGALEFLKAPIQRDFLSDLQKEIQEEFKKSFKNLNTKESFTEKVEKDLEAQEIKKLLSLRREKSSEFSKLKQKTDKPKSALKAQVLEKLGEYFLPEFLNRLDDVIIFEPLKLEELKKICQLMIEEVTARLYKQNIILSVSNHVKNKLTKQSYNPAFGARPLRRSVTKYVEDLISEAILANPHLRAKGKRLYFELILRGDEICVEIANQKSPDYRREMDIAVTKLMISRSKKNDEIVIENQDEEKSLEELEQTLDKKNTDSNLDNSYLNYKPIIDLMVKTKLDNFLKLKSKKNVTKKIVFEGVDYSNNLQELIKLYKRKNEKKNEILERILELLS